jgi:hypothetical protein
VTCPGPRRAKRPFTIHQADLPPVDRAVIDEIPVTSLSRTILDIAVTSPQQTVGRYIERAEDAKVFDLREMRPLLERAKGHRGVAKVQAALDSYRPKRKFTRSGLERRFLEVVREAGLPEPAMNLFVAGHELDAYWEEDRVRSDDFLLAGLKVTRVTETRLDREPEKVVESLRGHLSGRAVIE